MHDIAREAGVHQTTVSRALRNDRRLPEATRKRIQAIAESAGYRVNPLVSALVSARWSRHEPAYVPTIAYVVREDLPVNGAGSRKEARREYLRGARAAAEAQGFRVEEFIVGDAGMSEHRLDTVLQTRNVHGIIIAPMSKAHGHFTLQWDRYCTVVIEYTFNDPAFDRVIHDSYDGMRTIMAQCRLRGLARVGLALTATGHERTEGTNVAAYWLEQKTGQFFAPVPPLILPAWSEPDFAVWMRAHRPRVIVTSNDFARLGADWCREHGRDVGSINMNTTAASEFSGVFQDPFLIGSTAARIVIGKVMHNDTGVPGRRQTILTPGTWIEGRTLRAPAGAAAARAVLANA